MEENVALDSTKQKKFDKSIKSIKKLIKKKDAETEFEKGVGEKVKTGRVGKKRRPQRGLVYLSHIPHGFYENEMSQYFKQFGVVTNARVIKSKRTGQSKGFAFVEFKEPAVAQIVAETMNNYLMGKRLIKAAYIPPEKQKRKAFRRHWNAINNPGNKLRMKMKKVYNENKDEQGELKRAKKLLTNINKTKKKLKELGINYDFFTPVDVPEVLAQNVQIKIENEDTKEIIKKKHIKTEDADAKLMNKIPKDATTEKTKTKKSSNIEKKKEQDKKVQEKKSMKQDETNKNLQKQKKKNSKDKGITSLEEFIKVGNDSDNESNSSLEFDSDEFEKMLEGDDSDLELFQNASGSDDEENDVGEENLSKQKPVPNATSLKQFNKNAAQKNTKTKQEHQHQQPAKRKSQQRAPDPLVAESKKLKFEKQSYQKSRNKQFKKKK